VGSGTHYPDLPVQDAPSAAEGKSIAVNFFGEAANQLTASKYISTGANHLAIILRSASAMRIDAKVLVDTIVQ
jgi:hypothetical protein